MSGGRTRPVRVDRMRQSSTGNRGATTLDGHPVGRVPIYA